MKTVLVTTAVSLTLALFACSSDSSSGSSNSGSGTSAVNKCGSSSSQQSSSKCTQAELDNYGKCPIEQCDAEYQACLGSGYKSGAFTGPCKAYFDCTNACACGDTACLTKCTQDSACTSCLTQKVAPCTQSKCPPPSCLTGGTTLPTSDAGSSSGTACADLDACCAQMTGADKDQCTQIATSAKSAGAAACGPILSQYKTQSKCK